MSPDLLALARAYMALPGAPAPISRETPHPGWRDGIYRDYEGRLWRLIQTCDPDTGKWDTGWWAPDLTDDATGGVMLGMLGWHGVRVRRRAPNGDMMPWWADLYFSDRPRVLGAPEDVNCATLAEACARVAVALGRAA